MDIVKYTANIHLTHACNMRCTYCYAGEKINTSMTHEVMQETINFIAREVEEKKVNKLILAFLGGEPLMEKQKLFFILDGLNEILGDKVKIVAQLSTNGLLLSEGVMEELTRREILISLSVDGTPETMKSQRPTLGNTDYSKTIEKTIANVLKYNPFTNAFCVVTPQSAKNLNENIQWIYNQGLRYINCTLDYSGNWTNADFENLKSEYQKLAKWYENLCDNIEHFYFSSFDERIQTRTKKPAEDCQKCAIGYNQVSIAPNGILYPCTQFVKPPLESDKNMESGSIDGGWFPEKLKDLKQDMGKEKTECEGCRLKDRCITWCSCVNYSSTKTITKASPVACYHEKLLIPIVDELSNRLYKQKNQLFLQKHYNPLYDFVAQAMN